jgi:hypothetical protein
MTELFNHFESLLPWLKLLAVVFIVLAVAVTLGVTTFTLRATCSPLGRVVQWLFWHTPGTPPNAVVAGISHGARLLFWATLLGLGVWMFVHLLRIWR